jgi:hypothetical protein
MLSRTKTIVWAAVCAILAGWCGSAQAVVYENSRHFMASGDFFLDGTNDVVYVRGDGSLFVHDFNGFNSHAIGSSATKVIAADLNADGRDEALYLNSSGQVQSYDFGTKTTATLPTPGGVHTGYFELSAGDTDGTPGHELMLATNSAGTLFLYDPQTATFTATPGNTANAAGRINAGELVGGNAGDEFLVTNGAVAAPFGYNAATNSYFALGGGVDEVIAGNMFPSDATDEVFVNNAGKGLFLQNDPGSGAYVAGGSGEAIAVGRTDADLVAGQELFHVIGGLPVARQVYTMIPGQAENAGLAYTLLKTDPSNTGSADVINNGGFTDLILADVDNDGLDEVIARKGDRVFRFDAGAAAITVSTPNAVTTTGTFTGGDPGEGLDLQGDFVAAVNVLGPGGLQVGDALFTDEAGAPNVTIAAENTIPNWLNANYGATANDDALEQVMQSIRWTNSQDAGLNTLDITLDDLEIGTRYKLQLLMANNGGASDRHFNLFLEDELALFDFQMGAMQGANANLGVVLTHEFLADADSLFLQFTADFLTSGDRNPILNGLTLERILPVPEPATGLLALLGLGALAARRRRCC